MLLIVTDVRLIIAFKELLLFDTNDLFLINKSIMNQETIIAAYVTFVSDSYDKYCTATKNIGLI